MVRQESFDWIADELGHESHNESPHSGIYSFRVHQHCEMALL